MKENDTSAEGGGSPPPGSSATAAAHARTDANEPRSTAQTGHYAPCAPTQKVLIYYGRCSGRLAPSASPPPPSSPGGTARGRERHAKAAPPPRGGAGRGGAGRRRTGQKECVRARVAALEFVDGGAALDRPVSQIGRRGRRFLHELVQRAAATVLLKVS
jgi:hypothetical protein